MFLPVRSIFSPIERDGLPFESQRTAIEHFWVLFVRCGVQYMHRISPLWPDVNLPNPGDRVPTVLDWTMEEQAQILIASSDLR